MVLDFGGVISRTLFETHPITGRALGLAPGSLDWRGPFDPLSDALWVAMQNDELTEREYWSQRTREVGKLVGEMKRKCGQRILSYVDPVWKRHCVGVACKSRLADIPNEWGIPPRAEESGYLVVQVRKLRRERLSANACKGSGDQGKQESARWTPSLTKPIIRTSSQLTKSRGRAHSSPSS